MYEGEVRKFGRHWTILIFSITASAGLAIALGQDSGFDLLNYHYYSGFALLHKRFGYDFAPAQLQTFHNPLLHVFSYLALAHLSAKWAAAVMGAVQGLNFYLVFRITQILFSTWNKSYRYVLGLACAGAGFYGITSSTELGATYGDNVISMLVLAGLLLLLPLLQSGAISERKSTAVFVASGVLFGAAFGLKFTSAIYLLGLLAALPLTLAKSRGGGRAAITFACGSAIGFLAAYGFWGVHLYLSYQNPFFPYLNKAFRSPFFEPSNFLDNRFFPRDWVQALFYPFFFVRNNNLASEVGFRDLRLALCYVAVAMLISAILVRYFRRDTATERKPLDRSLIFLASFFAISYASWLELSSIYRYLSVLELLAPAFLALTVSRFLKGAGAVLCSTIVLSVVIVFWAVPISFGRAPFVDDLLKLRLPSIRELDKSIILMTGYEPIAYIVPSFPDETRFLRISSTFATPGRNRFVDAYIRQILAGYNRSHRYAYVPNAQEIGETRLDASAYGTTIDAKSCYEIRTRDRRQNQGYLCGVAGEQARTEEMPVPEIRYSPKFIEPEGAEFSGAARGNFFHGHIEGIRSGFLDILYKLDGELMPAIRRWALENSSVIHLGPFSRSGGYQIIGIRDSSAPDPDVWIPVKVLFRIDTIPAGSNE